jgi:hypothetical protein
VTVACPSPCSKPSFIASRFPYYDYSCCCCDHRHQYPYYDSRSPSGLSGGAGPSNLLCVPLSRITDAMDPCCLTAIYEQQYICCDIRKFDLTRNPSNPRFLRAQRCRLDAVQLWSACFSVRHFSRPGCAAPRLAHCSALSAPFVAAQRRPLSSVVQYAACCLFLLARCTLNVACCNVAFFVCCIVTCCIVAQSLASSA